MSTSSSSKSVLAALAANALVTVLKLVAFLFSGSASMLSETIHSFADTGNQLLLLVGLRRGTRRPDREHHYGYSSERFVFGLLSAAGIFFVGCGVTVYHGVSGLIAALRGQQHDAPHINAMTFVILGASFIIEGGVLLYAFTATVRVARADKISYGKYLREKADPATLAVLLEDSIAVFGLILASAGVAATYWTKQFIWDSIGSTVVGLLLGVVAVLLVRENRALLLGKAAPPEVEARFAEVVGARPSVRLIRDMKSRQLTPDEFIFKAEIAFDADFLAARLDEVAPRPLEQFDGGTLSSSSSSSSSSRRDALHSIAGAATRILAEEIDSIEAAIRLAIPEAKHIDLEIDRGEIRDMRGQLPRAATWRL